MKNRVIVIVGPTASGKTGYSIHLAQRIASWANSEKLSFSEHGRISAEVISADSRQIYTGLDIGTGKVTAEESQGIPHHMLDIALPGEVYSAHRYATAARTRLEEVWARAHIPIVCGGTGLYIDALFGRVTLGETGRDDVLRAELEALSCEELLARLQHTDPTRAQAIEEKGEQKNKVRLVRALEIARSSESLRENSLVEPAVRLPSVTMQATRGLFREALSELSTTKVLWLGLKPTPTELRTNIHKRLHDRLEHGMLEEVTRLHNEGLSWDRMEKLGLEYRYCARHLQDLISREELATILEQKIWQYAKRQINWWKRNPDIHWFHPTQIDEMDALALDFLKK